MAGIKKMILNIFIRFFWNYIWSKGKVLANFRKILIMPKIGGNGFRKLGPKMNIF